MAFPIPSHLPRKQDVSSKILSKIDEATGQTLNASLASSWLAELDETILLTKKRIHERRHADLPSFERQLSSSKSVQERLHSLTENVDNIGQALEHPETGLVPTLVRALAAHTLLAQNSSDATVTHDALSHLQRCRAEFDAFSSSVQAGKLPEAVAICRRLIGLLDQAPFSLRQAEVMGDMKRRLRALKDRVEEQLSDAYSQSIIISPSEIIVRPSVQIRKSETTLDISSILSSLSPESLTSHLTTLRRDITTHYIDHILSQPCSLTISSDPDGTHQLAQFPSPPNSENRTTRLDNMSSIISFLQAGLFTALPSSQRKSWPQSLCKPLTTAILHKLLIPSLPSSLVFLPGFLELVKQATEFEDTCVIGILGNVSSDREIKMWADGVSGHYERKRRMEILEAARVVVTRAEDGSTFMAEVVSKVAGGEASPRVVPVQGDMVKEDGDAAWGLDEEEAPEETGWGFDDEPEAAPEEAEADPADAWGWNEEEPEASPVDDDPWAEALDEPTASPAPIYAPIPASKEKAPRPNGAPTKRPPEITTKPKGPSKETYLVSRRTRDIVRLVENILVESQEFASSHLFPSVASPGGTILQCAVSVLDLYRALYPVTFGSYLVLSTELAMRFSNDCIYLSDEVARIEVEKGQGTIVERLETPKDNLRVLGQSWFEDSIDKQRQAVDEILVAAEGFTETGEQERFDDCESAVMRVLREIRSLATQWKTVLPKSKYYVALGSVVDAALSRVLEDVLNLDDIPEIESHRLSDLCKILNALEGLFVEDREQPSFVVAYVPSWLKYSYLSELLEASIADISYLFQEGALVDFQVDELAKLVRALFADTPLRTTTINKLLSGHPVTQED